MIGVYVMGASRELERAKKAMALVNESDLVELALDWTADFQKESTPDVELGVEEQREYATRDFNAVFKAEICWLLIPVPTKPSNGAWVEYGIAVASNKFIVASGRRSDWSLFTSLAEGRFESDAAAFEALLIEARRRLKAASATFA